MRYDIKIKRNTDGDAIAEYTENGVICITGHILDVYARAAGRLMARCEILEKEHGDCHSIPYVSVI